jgi:transcriptional regulator of acetoin/glycerol metabolism
VLERATIISTNNRLQTEDFYFLDESVVLAGREEPDTLNLDEMEKETVRRAMQKFNGNISKVAKELGLSRASLYRRLEKYEL